MVFHMCTSFSAASRSVYYCYYSEDFFCPVSLHNGIHSLVDLE